MTTNIAVAQNGRNGKSESPTFDHEDESSPFALSPDNNEDDLLTLVEIARRIEADETKHAAVLAKIKRLVAHASVRELLGAVRTGGKGFRYPESAVEQMHFLVTNPLVSAANADEYLKTLERKPATNDSILTRTCESSTFDLHAFAEIIGAAIRQSSESSTSVLLPLVERLVTALEGQTAKDRAVPKAEAAALMGIAESSVNRHLPALSPGHVSELHVQAWLTARRTAAEQRRANRRRKP